MKKIKVTLFYLSMLFFISFYTSSCEKSGTGGLTINTSIIPDDSDEDILEGFFQKSQPYEVYIQIRDSKDKDIKPLQSIGVRNLPPVWNSDLTWNTNRYIDIPCFSDLPTGKNYKLSVILQKTSSSGSKNLGNYSKEIIIDKIVNGQTKVLKVDCDIF